MHALGRIALSLGFATGLTAGCLNIGAYTCSNSSQCSTESRPGFCQPTGYCSYMDESCPTGFRYGDEAEDGLAGECVEPQGATDTDTDTPGTTGTTTGTTTGSGSSETSLPTTLSPTTTDGDSSSETGDTCGSLSQPCCDEACDDGLSCYGGTCGCIDTIAAGNEHTCVTRTDGAVYCWGANDGGQLGAAGVLSSPVPIRAAETLLGAEGLRALQLDASAHTCALREDGNAVCWGENGNGASIPGMPSKAPAVPTAITLATNWVQPATGSAFTCIAREADFLATCFGRNDRGQLTGKGQGPLDIEALFNFVEIGAGGSHVCGRTNTGGMYCWGENTQGQLGYISPIALPFATTVRELPIPPVGDIAVGTNHTCARVGDDVLCWGDNAFGQLGNGATEDATVPVIAPLPDSPVATLTADGNVTCAKLGTAEVYCWGDNTGNKLQISGETKVENDAFTPSPLLFDPADADGMAIEVDAAVFGNGHACILSATHDVFCWGLNAQGQAGNGLLTAQVLTPEQVALSCD